MSAEIISFGCRLNSAEGEAIRLAAEGADDLIIFNTCAVTAEAERQARQAIRKAARAHPEKRIVVTGCAAEVSRAKFAAMAEVSAVVGNAGKRSPTAYVAPAQAGALGGLAHPVDTLLRREAPAFAGATLLPAVTGTDHVRAFVEVQNGCDHDCTFCITTIARGASRSIPVDAVVAAIRDAVERGANEAVLTGVDLTSYGPDLAGAPTLGALVEAILREVPMLPRLRLSSLDCIEIDPLLFEIITGEDRLMPHLHLSLQSGDDMILKRMKRRHSRGEAVTLVERIKSKREVTIGADLIAGFPTEDAAMFAGSLALLDDCDVVLGHIFPYSPRPGTAAARMPQLGRALAKERAGQLRARVAERKAEWLQSLVGTQQSVLVERGGVGHTPGYAEVTLADATPTRFPELVEGQYLLGSSERQNKDGPSTSSGMRLGGITRMYISGTTGDTLLAEPG